MPVGATRISSGGVIGIGNGDHIVLINDSVIVDVELGASTPTSVILPPVQAFISCRMESPPAAHGELLGMDEIKMTFPSRIMKLRITRSLLMGRSKYHPALLATLLEGLTYWPAVPSLMVTQVGSLSLKTRKDIIAVGRVVRNKFPFAEEASP